MSTRRIYPVRGGGISKKVLAVSVLAIALSLAALAGTASAADDVQAGRTIEAFIGSNLVNVQNYPANTDVTIDVMRNGLVVSSVSGTTDAAGFAEFNHVGGGQVPGGDCFKPPVSPDVMAGDVIRTRTAGDPAGRFDTAVVRDISVDFPVEADRDALGDLTGTITMTGNVTSFADGVVVPGEDILEARLNKANRNNPWANGRRDLRDDVGDTVDTNTGDFSFTFNVGLDDAADWDANGGEAVLEWSAAPANPESEADPPAIFVADEAGGEAVVGCPPFAENAITSSVPTTINRANLSGGLRLDGISKDAGAVSVALDDEDGTTTDAITAPATITPAYVDGFQTWSSASITAQQLGAMSDGNLTARVVVDSVTQNLSLRILKDTVAPTRPTATPGAGTYRRPQFVTLDAQPRTTIHYTLNGDTPTAASPVYTRQIRIANTRTLRAIAIDRADNQSPVASFRYVIR